MTLDKDIKDIEREFEKLANLEIRVIIPVDDLLKEAFESSNIQKVRTAISKAKSKGLNETQRKIITSGLENFVYKTNYVCHSFSNREFLVKELVSLKPDNTNYLFKLAEVYRGESVDKEKQLLYKILCLDSNNSGAKNRLYELLIKQKDGLEQISDR